MRHSPLSRFPRSAIAATAGILSLLPLAAACGSPDAGQARTAPESVPSNAVIIDVRTPEEFAEQHLQGALNINLRDADFVQQIQALDRSTPYAVYCRSGNRSAQAVQIMKDLGFTSVSDHGSVAQASDSLGVAVVS